MFAISISSCRLVRKLSSPHITSFSRYTYSELYKTSARVSSTTSIYKTFDGGPMQRRYLSQGEIKASVAKEFSLDFKHIAAQTKEIINNVKMTDLKEAPQPAFWYGFGGLVPFVLPSLSFLVFGYSPFLACAQLSYGATICSFLGGVRWGYTVDVKSSIQPTWETLGFAVAPQLIAWVGLLLPQLLGFVMVSGGLAAAAYMDLVSSVYPPWFKALRLCLTIPAVVCLLFSALLSLFH